MRRHGFAAAAIALVALDLVARLTVGAPYSGATILLLCACGLSLMPFLPGALAAPSHRLAVLPALGLASFSGLLTTVSIVGIPLGELSIRLAVGALVVALAVASTRVAPAPQDGERPSRRREALVLLGLAGVVAFALASSWDVAYPFQARGTDWGHYLLYAEEVEAQKHLLIDDPLAGEEDRIFADPPGVGVVYGSFLLLDGISSWSLTAGIVVVSALSVLSVYVAAGGLWGAGAGLAAAATYAVAPIRLDPMYWHGLGTTLALVFLPLVVLAVGLLFRGQRGSRTVVLLAVALVGVAAAHATSAVVTAAFVVVAPLVDLATRLIAGRAAPGAALRSWWADGIVKPLAAGVGVACVLGAGVIAHLWLQAAALGRPVSYRFLGPDWLDRAAIQGYYSWPFLTLAAAAVVLVLASRRSRQDPALLAVVSLVLGCFVVSQLWRVEVPFEYRRVVYYLGVAFVLLVGLALVRRRPAAAWFAVFALALVYLARESVGLRLAERVLDREPRAPAVSGLTTFRDLLDNGALPDAERVVSDPCLHFAVPYLVRRPTLPAFGERQVGFVDRLPLARQAARILAGGTEGRRLAARLGVGYVVGDPGCVPDVAAKLGGTVVVRNEGLVVVRLPSAAELRWAGTHPPGRASDPTRREVR